MAVRSNGSNAGDLLREPDLERSLTASAGEPLTYRPRSGADLLVRPFYAIKQGERYSIYLDPNRHSHRTAHSTGDGWRDSDAFRYSDRPGDSAAFAFHGTGVRWIGFRFDDAGIAEVRIDDRRSPGSTSTAPAATSRSNGARKGSPTAIIASHHHLRSEDGGIQGPIHQYRRIRGDPLMQEASPRFYRSAFAFANFSLISKAGSGGVRG